jgi:hypothetical protein
MNIPDDAVEDLVAAWEQFKTGSSPSDIHRLEMAAGSFYYAVKGTDE